MGYVAAMRAWLGLLTVVGACACSATVSGTVGIGADVPIADAPVDAPTPMEASVDAGSPPTPVERCPVAPPPLPAALPEPTATSVVIDVLNECRVLRDGTAHCRGNNSWGQLGSGFYDDGSATPRPVVNLTDARQISFSSLANRVSLHADGTLRAWGNPALLGTPPPDVCGSQRCSVSPRPIPGIDRVVSVATALGGACALRDDRTLWCWGLTVGLTGSESLVPRLVDDRRDVVEVFSGLHFVVPRRADGTLLGRAASEGLGTSVPPAWTIAAGSALHLCATLPDRTMRCWGPNTHGQLGADEPRVPTLRETPRDPGLDCVRAVSRGYEHTCALRTDGTVWCWGSNTGGESGAPAAANEPCPNGSGQRCIRHPRRVEGIDHADSLYLGPGRTCAIRSDRTVWCWGISLETPMGSPVPVRDDWQ